MHDPPYCLACIVGESGGNPDDDFRHGTRTTNVYAAYALEALQVVKFPWVSKFQSPNRRGAASMSSQKKGRPGMKEGTLVQMLDSQRVQQAYATKKLVDAAALAAERLEDATKAAGGPIFCFVVLLKSL